MIAELLFHLDRTRLPAPSSAGEGQPAAHTKAARTTTIAGLPPGHTVYFRFRALTRGRHIDFSQVVSSMIK